VQANSSWATHEIRCILWNLEVHYHDHNSPSLIPTWATWIQVMPFLSPCPSTCCHQTTLSACPSKPCYHINLSLHSPTTHYQTTLSPWSSTPSQQTTSTPDPQHPVIEQPSVHDLQHPDNKQHQLLFLNTLFSNNPQHLTLSVFIEWKCDGYIKWWVINHWNTAQSFVTR